MLLPIPRGLNECYTQSSRVTAVPVCCHQNVASVRAKLSFTLLSQPFLLALLFFFKVYLFNYSIICFCKRETERRSIYRLTCQMPGMARSGHGRSQEAAIPLGSSNVGGRGPNTSAAFYCFFPRPLAGNQIGSAKAGHKPVPVWKLASQAVAIPATSQCLSALLSLNRYPCGPWCPAGNLEGAWEKEH